MRSYHTTISDDSGTYGLYTCELGYTYSEPITLPQSQRQQLAVGAFERKIGESFRKFSGSRIQDWRIPPGVDAATKRAMQRVSSDVRDWASYWQTAAGQAADDRTGALSRHQTLVLAGAPGCGKTHLAIASLRRIAVGGGVSSWQAWTVADLLATIKARFDDQRLPDPVPACVSSRVLVLDDLGAHSRTPWAAEALLGIVDARYRNNPNGVMILTTNAGALGDASFWQSLLSERREAEPVVQRLASRLAEGALLVPFGSVRDGQFTPLRDERQHKGGAS